jgi:hypothetical protein
MRRRKGKLESIAKLIDQVYPSHQPEEVRALRVFAAFTRAAPARILRNALPVSYKHNVLTVHTTTAAWANALSLESAQLLAKLRFRLKDITVQRIAFRVGKLPEVPEQVQPEPPPPKLLPLERLPPELARELAHIADDGLRERVARAISISLAERVVETGKKRG